MNRLLPLLLLALLLPTLYAHANIHATRTWTGKNGKSFTGQYLFTDKNTGKIFFHNDRNGKQFGIDPKNISEADLAFIRSGGKSPRKETPGGPAEHFKPDPALDRSTLRTVSQGKYGNKASDCVPSSFCTFLLWWDQTGYLQIPRRGDHDKKAEWVHSRMARYCKTRNNSGTSARDFKEAAQKYFTSHLEGSATFRYTEVKDTSPASLAQWTKGSNATMLGVATYYGDDYEGGHWIALRAADAQGNLEILTWGLTIKAKMTPLPKDPKDRHAPTQYTIQVLNTADMPQWFRDYEISFRTSQRRSLHVITPYRYAKEKLTSPPPADDRYPFQEASKHLPRF